MVGLACCFSATVARPGLAWSLTFQPATPTLFRFENLALHLAFKVGTPLTILACLSVWALYEAYAQSSRSIDGI